MEKCDNKGAVDRFDRVSGSRLNKSVHVGLYSGDDKFTS